MSHPEAFSYRSVPLSAVSCDLFWNLHPWAAETVPEALQRSFERSGILSPPSLLPAENGEKHYRILTGHRRILFAKSQMEESKEIVCRYYHQQPPPRQCLEIIVDDQQYGGQGLSIAEKARFLDLAAGLLPKAEQLEEFLPLLGLKKNPELLKNLLSLAKENKSLLQAAHTGEISLQIYTELQRLPSADRISLLELFFFLQLGGGKQRRFFQLIRDCAYTRSQSIPQFLQNEAIQQILHHTQLNSVQKTQQLDNLLQNMLQPTLRHAEEQFRGRIGQLVLPKNYQIQHSPAFEKDDVTLQVTFSHLETCERYLQATSSVREEFSSSEQPSLKKKPKLQGA